MKAKTRNKLILLAVIAALTLIALLVPAVNRPLMEAIRAISSVDIETVIAYIRGYGPYAAVVSFLLMILQSILSPIPAFLITLANAAIFGWMKGALLSWTSSMAGAALCFFLARYLGRDFVEKITSKGALQSVDGFFERYGKYTILIARLLPFVSFDIISYAAGLTSMGFVSFFIATGIGQLPATLVYSYLGQLSGNAQTIMIALLLLFALTVLIYMIKLIYNGRTKKRKHVE